MVVKHKSAVKPKSKTKSKFIIKLKNKRRSKQNDFTHLSEDIISNMGVGIYIVQQGKFVYVSALFLKLTGYSKTEIIGKNSLDFIYSDDREMVKKKAINSLKGESKDNYEYRFIRKNSEVMWVLEMLSSIKYKGERAALGSFMDITERKRADDSSQRNEEKYRTILEEMENTYFELDLAGHFTFVNDACCRLLGYSKEELLGTDSLNTVVEEERRHLYNIYSNIFRTSAPARGMSYKVIRKDGTAGFAETSSFPLKNEKGEIIGFRGVGRDITERRQMEEALRQSEEKYRTLIENIKDGYFEIDLTGNFTFFNESLREIHGYPREELMGMNHRQYADKQNAGKVFEAFNKIYRTGKTGSIFDYEIIKKDGTKRQVEVSASLKKDLSGNPIGFRGITRDVTERKRTEEMIRQSEERYRTIIDEMENTYFELDLAGNFTFFNDTNCRQLGYSREEMMGTNSLNTVAEEDRERLNNIYYNIFRTATPARGMSYKIIRKDGITGFAETSSFPLQNEKGEIIGFRGVGRDVTERKLMEEALRQSEERYRTIMDEMEEWYFETDLSVNILFFNNAMARALGYLQKKVFGLNFRVFFNQKEADTIDETFHQVYETGKPIKNFPLEFVRPGGSIIFSEISVLPKLDQEGKISGFRGVGHDITARKRAEEQIRYLATHDGLTDLPNRMMFSQLLNHSIRSAQRYKRQFAIFFIDLDHFKIINDTLGHEAGDQLLQEMAVRFKQTLRASDVVARLGGDEFVMLIEEVNNLNQITTIAQKILCTALKPLSLMGEECRITASMGISIYPKDGEDELSLIKTADKAMYFAKEKGKNNFQFYSKDIKP